MRIALALSILLLLTASIGATADAPRIACITSGGGSSAVIGDGFDSTSKVITWNTPRGQQDVQKYAGDMNGPATLPTSPPADARELTPFDVPNAQVLDVVLPQETTIMWVKTAGGISAPRLVNAPEIWLTTNDQPAPGDQMRLFGRNFCLQDTGDTRTPGLSVLFRSRTTGETTMAATAELSEQEWEHTKDHAVGIIVPAALTPGPYDILVHSAFSGSFGWSAPYRVDVVDHRGLAAAFARFDHASSSLSVAVAAAPGLKGDGLHDDTQAIQSALDGASAAGGGVVLLPAGQFAISKTLRIEPGVFLRGVGEKATSIVIAPTTSLKGGLPDVNLVPSLTWQRGYAGDWTPYLTGMTPMIWMQTKSGVSDLSLVGGPGAKCSIFVATRDWHTISEDVSVVRTSITTSQRKFQYDGYRPYVFGIAVLAATRNFTVAQCHIRCGDPICMYPTRPEHYGTTITNNTFEVFPRQSTDNVYLDSLSHAVIDDNDFIGGSRAVTVQRGLDNSWIFNNRVIDDGGWANAEEMFMSEYGGDMWAGACQSASADTIQAQGAKWSAGQFLECSDPIYVFIKLGKGFGQIRRVTANTADTLTVDTPWDIVPDSTTRFAVLTMSYRDLYVNDQTIDCNGRCEFGNGAMAESVVEGLNTRDAEGLSSTALNGGILAFNQYCYNRMIGMSGLRLQGPGDYDQGVMTIPGADTGEGRRGNVIANTIRGNEVMNFREYALNQSGPVWHNLGKPQDEPGISVTGGSFNIIDDNYVTKGGVGIRVDGDSNVVTHNRIDDVLTPIVDLGRETYKEN